jgi:FKBP-type peptidyl-prolyl cis-trans isomerase 2
MAEILTVQNGMKVSIDYTLTVDSVVVDASPPGQPLQFVQGKGQIVRGLEAEILDMMVGETKEVDVEPESAYGLINPDYIISVPRSRIPAHIPVDPGTVLTIPAPNGQSVPALVLEANSDTVRLDLNHPMAGKKLHFKVTIAALS